MRQCPEKRLAKVGGADILRRISKARPPEELPMDRTPPPTTLAQARALPFTPGRSAEVFVDGDLELRFSPHPTNGPQVPHLKDEIYIVAAGTSGYQVEGRMSQVGPGDVLFCAAHVAHGFVDPSEDFCVWVLFYGPTTQAVTPGR
jgi:mannose-6-phosphate isomerase-like protein (cupin superfamily)